jgi:cell division protease FtsH
MQANELFGLLTSKPEAVGSITFLNGSERIIVYKSGDPTKYFVTLPEQGGRQEILKLAVEKKVTWKAEDDSTAALRGFAFAFGPLIVLGLIFLFMFNRNRNGAGGMAGGKPGFGKSRAKSADDPDSDLRKVTFNDVAGCDQAVEELRRVAKGLKRRKLYEFFGVKLPKGVILEGPPGTGKTLLARALAGETDGTFDATSGSDFVEMFVGVGASRVRDMFEQGRAKVKETGKPHIIFIDEIDAVGGKRGGGSGESSNSEREQTLNAILVEMDGMKNNEGLIIVAATNRLDMLDDALLRPGRFDCHVTVDLPTKDGRAAIFAIHTRNKPLAADVNCALLAERTYGYSGAEIEGACNRAALLAAERHGQELPDDATSEMIMAALQDANAVIEAKDFDEGIDFVRYGASNPARQKSMSANDKNNTTVHEAGHAIVSDVMPGAHPVVKITIVNRSKALGYVQNMPAEDSYSNDFEQIVARIVTSMAGRAAQMLLLNKMDTGASNDFEQACQMAHRMVTLWGMSRVGFISVGRGGSAMRGFGSGPVTNYGPKLADEIDDEWRRIVNDCYAMAMHIVTVDRERLEAFVAKLQEEETVLSPGWKEFTKTYPSKVDPKNLVLDISPVNVNQKGA